MATTQKTTRGFARLQNGKVIISFGFLSGGRVTDVDVDVDPYALELSRDLLIALGEQKGIAEDLADQRGGL